MRPTIVALLIGMLSLASPLCAQNSITYQGVLDSAGAPYNGPALLRFTFFDAPTGGTAISTPQTVAAQVTQGVFSVHVPVSEEAFRNGAAAYIQIDVLDQNGVPTPLSPRQAITPAPLALGVAGMRLDTLPPVDQAQTGPVNGSAIASFSGNYQSFTAGRNGRLSGITFLIQQPVPAPNEPTFFATVFRGVGTGGQSLGSVDVVVPRLMDPTEFTLDLSALNIDLIAGQTYTVSLLCGALFQTTSDAIPGASGSLRGNPVNYWFRTNLEPGVQPATATMAATALTANSATTAANATNAAMATLAQQAQQAQTLVAQNVSALNDFELRLRVGSDPSHGLGYFGGPRSFRTTGFAPDGPVLFGFQGGGLGTTAGTAAIALRWNAAGNVGIGIPPENVGSYRLALPNTAGPAGQGRANAWVTYSSREYKQNIRTLDDAGALLDQLRGVRFDWKDSTSADGMHDIGFIAEEVATVLPELVTTDPNGAAAGLDYGRIVPIAVEALKSQRRQIEAQNAQIDELKERLDRLEKLIRE